MVKAGATANTTKENSRASRDSGCLGSHSHGEDTHGEGQHRISLHVEYAEQSIKYGILFIFSLFYEYINLEYVRICVIYRVNQAEYVIRIRVAASQEYVNTSNT